MDGFQHALQVNEYIERLAKENAEFKDRVASLEAAIRGLVVDVYDDDGPAYRACSACSAMDAPYSFEHEDRCPAKPALNLVFGARDSDHVKEVK